MVVLGEVRGRRELTEVRGNFREVMLLLDFGDGKGIPGRERTRASAL